MPTILTYDLNTFNLSFKLTSDHIFTWDEWMLFLKRFDWYENCENCDPDVPSHNTPLESINNVIKKEVTFRERAPTAKFFHKVEHDIVVQWSKARGPMGVNAKVWKNKPDFVFKGINRCLSVVNVLWREILFTSCVPNNVVLKILY